MGNKQCVQCLSCTNQKLQELKDEINSNDN